MSVLCREVSERGGDPVLRSESVEAEVIDACEEGFCLGAGIGRVL